MSVICPDWSQGWSGVEDPSPGDVSVSAQPNLTKYNDHISVLIKFENYIFDNKFAKLVELVPLPALFKRVNFNLI